MGLYLMSMFASFNLIAASEYWQAWGDRLWMIFCVACGLGFVVFVHELGHFLVAKWCGVKCEKFYVGFDVPIKLFGIRLPTKLVHFQWGETEYGVGIIPLGGYVKMLGQDDDPRVSKQRQEMERIRINNGEEAGGQPEQQLDPRSFPAKTVPQRMAIISAGVIMNLIFAVIFATFAYRAGVPYTPCEVGIVVPGGPAWEAGIQPGARFIQIGENGRQSEGLRFDWDLRNGVAMAGDREDLYVLTRTPDGTEQPLRVRPSVANIGGHEIPTIGIVAAHTNSLMTSPSSIKGTPAATATPELKGGDTIVAVDGQSIQDWYQLNELLAQVPDRPVTLTVKRDETDGEAKSTVETTLDVVIQPNHLKRMGLVVKAGPIVALRPDSPATEAGFQVGDKIETIAGEPMGDPMSLPSRLRPYEGQEIEVVVQRDGKPVTLHVTPRTPKAFDWTFSFNSPMASEALGLAFEVEREVEAVVPGSPAEQQGVLPGDKILSFQYLTDDPDVKAGELPNSGKPIDLEEHGLPWTVVFNNMQTMRDHDRLKLWLQQGSQIRTVEVAAVETEEFNPDRGFVFATKSEIYVAKSWSEALMLGANRTLEDATRVFGFVTKLFTGKIPLSNVGGPLTIAYVAGSEANAGLPRLLIFLTLLSANLAVVNFLPIPALDGGHFLFLLWEGISGKPASEQVQIALTLAGVACLLCFMVFIVALDIQRLFL